MAVERKKLLGELKAVSKHLIQDMRARAESAQEGATVDGAIGARSIGDGAITKFARVREEYAQAVESARVGVSFAEWFEGYLEQVAIHWVLGLVFVRFAEDNDLLGKCYLSGVGENLRRAEEQHRQYFAKHPAASDRDYLHWVFEEARALPALREIFSLEHNPLWRLDPSGDEALRLLDFFQKINPDTGALVLDFRDATLDTRFLGDLYQDLATYAKKRYALLQTPQHVEEFILSRTLLPAIDEFGLEKVQLIDPTCGSGHFLLGAFKLLLAYRERLEPARLLSARNEVIQEVLKQIAGVDINPFAVNIARFRLLVAALQACGARRLAEVPDFELNLACGDSLLHGGMKTAGGVQTDLLELVSASSPPRAKGAKAKKAAGAANRPVDHYYQAEEPQKVRRILNADYQVVVANPPYITVKDPALRELYRRWPSCYREYSLVVPFFDCCFDLAKNSSGGASGYVGLFVANSFMKREFGKQLIETSMHNWQLTHCLDTSGCHFEGHGTPTAIIFGRARRADNFAQTVRAVLGIRAEGVGDSGSGPAWGEICDLIDRPGTTGAYVSSSDMPLSRFHKHPWSIGGGGAAELVTEIVGGCEGTLESVNSVIGFVCTTRADDVYFSNKAALRRVGIEDGFIMENVEGDKIRDWFISDPNATLFPYDSDLRPVADNRNSTLIRYLWPHRTHLWLRREPNGNHREIGLTWYEWSRFLTNRFRTPLSLAFAFVATHNHFVLDRGGKVFNRSAPVIKLPAGATVDEHLGLLGLLNSSLACFWGRQTFQSKRGDGVGRWGEFLEWDATKLKTFPLPKGRPLELARSLDDLAARLAELKPERIIAGREVSAEALKAAEEESEQIYRQMIAIQEELDWQVYGLYRILEEDLTYKGTPPLVAFGQRAFELLLAKDIACGNSEQMPWFVRHQAEPCFEMPEYWPQDYCQLVKRRKEVIAENPQIALIETPECKRRWARTRYEELRQAALAQAFLAEVEKCPIWSKKRLVTLNKLAQEMSSSKRFNTLAEIYTGDLAFSHLRLLEQLVATEHVPYLQGLRYTESGRRKRKVWEECWRWQLAEDELEAQSKASPSDPAYLEPTVVESRRQEIQAHLKVPPRYEKTDFQKGSYWALRGKLDLPKERFLSFPGAESSEDPSLVLGYAGWNHLELAQAIAEYYLRMQRDAAWEHKRLLPLLTGLAEELLWLRIWHNEYNPEFQQSLSEYFAAFVSSQARELGITLEELTN